MGVQPQSGKTTIARMAAIHNCVLAPDLDAMMPRGQTRYALIGAPGLTQAVEFIRGAAAMVDASEAFRSLATVKMDTIEFELSSGARTAMGECRPQAARAA